MTRILFQLLLGVLLLIPETASSKRLALVIGVDQYEALPKLERAVSDARAIGAALEELGFEVVTSKNASRREMSKRLSEIEKRIEPGDTMLFCFAGHCIAIGAENILIPADMPLPESGGEGIVQVEGFAVDRIVRRLRERGAGATLLILDACRNNPFDEGGTRNIGNTRGLTRIEAASGVFVLMSAGAGQTALDRLPGSDTDPNSVFTRSLLPLLKKPGMSHIALAKAVQKEVARLASTVGHAQQPAYYDEILGEVVLNDAESAPAADTPAVTTGGDAAAEWANVKDTESPEVIEQFIAKYGDAPIYSALAREKLAQLKGEQSGAEDAEPAGGEVQTAVVAPEPAPESDAAYPVTECDRLAAVPKTAVTRGLGLEGVAFEKIDAAAAVAACQSAVAEAPLVARLQLSLGRALDAGRRMKEAFAAYEKAAKLGDGTAMNNIGVLYKFGDLGKADEAQAVAWFRRSAEAGDLAGMYNLGVNIWGGLGVKADPDEAFSWMQRSAEAGYSPAMTLLGQMYEAGVGTAKNDRAALVWYQKAAAENEYRAYYSLAVMLDAGRGMPVNTEQAADLFVGALGFGIEEAKRDVDAGATQWSDAFRKAVQRRLKEPLKVYQGEIDGIFGSEVKESAAKVFGVGKK